MLSYILIVVVYAKAYAHGTGDLIWPVVTMQEFADKEACDRARARIVQMANTKNISVACAPRSSAAAPPERK